jgi:hypothetical protein
MAAIECKLAMCISRLVKFELLLEVKFEQKRGTSLHTSCLSVPVIYFDIKVAISRTLSCADIEIYHWDGQTVLSIELLTRHLPKAGTNPAPRQMTRV